MKNILKISLAVLIFTITAPFAKAACTAGNTEITVTIVTKSYGNEVYWKIKDAFGNTIDSVRSGVYQSNTTYTKKLCVANNTQYYFEAWDVWGDGWDGGTYSLSANGTTIINNSGNSPTDGVDKGGVDTIEVVEGFKVTVDNFPDVALYSIISPTYTNCGTSALTVSAKVKVVKNVNVDTLYMNYQLGTATVVSQNFVYSPPLQKDTIVTITFTTKASPSGNGVHNLNVWCRIPLDKNASNDGKTMAVLVDSAKTTFPKTEDFSSATACGNNTSTCISDGTCDLGSIWRNVTNDDIDWGVNQGATESSGTGPAMDHTSGNNTGKYLFIESSSCYQKSAILQASCLEIDNMTSPYLYYWYHMYGSGIGKLYVEINTSGTWVKIDSLIGQKQTASTDAWRSRLVSLNSYKTTAHIRFRAVTGNSFTGDIALDDIVIKDFPNADAMVSAVLGPQNNTCGEASSTYKALITNLGLNAITSCAVKLTLSGALSGDYTNSYTGNLAFGSTDTVYFTGIDLTGGGIINVSATVTLVSDAVSGNNTATYSSSIVRIPQSTTVSDTGRCGAGTITLLSNSRVGDTTLWYSDASGVTLIATSDNYTTPSLIVGKSYYYQTKALTGNCYSTIKTVSVAINYGLTSGIGLSSPSTAVSGIYTGITHDSVPESSTVIYQISTPTGYTLGDYGFTWEVSAISLSTTHNTVATTTNFSEGAGMVPTFTFIPKSSEIDSNFRLHVELKDIQTGCVSEYSRNVVVRAVPSANFSANEVCLGQATTFSNASIVESGSLTYAWTFGDGGTSTLANPSHTYASAGTFSVKLVVSSDYGLTDEKTVTVTVNGNPTADFSYSNICLYQATNLINNSSVSSGTLTYEWRFGDGNTSNLSSPQHYYSSVGSYDLKLITSSGSSCKDSTTQKISVYGKPTAGFTVSNVCMNDSAHFINQSTDAVSYSWDLADGNGSIAQNPVYRYDSTATFGVKLVAIDTNSCRDTAIVNLQVYPMPTLSMSASNTCLYDSVEVSISATLADSYTWVWGDGNTSASANNRHKYSSESQYTAALTVTTMNGCSVQKTTTFDVYAAPDADFSTNTVCLGNSTVFTNASSINTGFISSKWNFGNGSTSNSISPSLKYAAAGTYSAQLITTSTKGCSDTMTKSVTVKALPSTKFSNGLICTGKSISFTNQTTGASYYKWHFGNGDSSSATAPTYTYNNAGTYTVRLIATTSKNCSVEFDSTMQVYITPSSVFSAANSCNGSAISIVNYSTNTNNYLWKFGDGSQSTQSTPNYTYLTYGTYSLKLINTNSSGCVDSSTKSITIYQSPTADFTTTDVCDGETVSWTNSSSNATSYNWQFGDGSSSTQTNPSHKYSSASTYAVQLIASTGNNCVDTIEKTVTIKAKPSVSFTTAANACAGDDISINNNTTGAAGYAWDFGDGTTSTVKNPTKTYNNPGTYWVKLVTTSTSSCTEADSSRVEIYPSPVGNFTASNICLGTASSFTNNSSLSSGKLSYSWDFDNGIGTSTLKSPTYYYSTAGTYDVKLKATSDKGCIDSVTATHEVYSLPQSSFSAAEVCYGDSTSFVNSSSNAAAYSWTMGTATSTSASPKTKFSSVGNHSVTLITESSNGCKDTLTKSVTVNPLPSAAFTAKAVCFGQKTVFANNSTIGNGSYNSLWSFGDGNTATSQSPEFSYSASGTYTAKVLITSNKGCMDSVSNSVTVHAMPTAKFATSLICTGQATDFINKSSGASTYKWYFGNGDSSIAYSPSQNYTSSGSFKVRFLATTDKKCTAEFDSTVQVYATPSLSYSASATCEKSEVAITNNSSGVSTYAWLFGDGKTSASSSPSHTYLNAGNYNIRLITSSSKGCKDSLDKSITIYKKPKADFSAGNVCLGDTADFKNNSSNTVSQVWSFGDGYSSNQINPTHYYSKSASFDVSLIAKSSDNCLDTAVKTLTIKAIPTIKFTSDSKICATEALTLTNKSTGASSYKWNFGDGTISTATLPSYSYTKSGTYWLKLDATSGSNCTVTDSLQIVVNPKPKVQFENNNVCLKENSAFINTSSLVSGKMTPYWSFGDGIGTSTLKNPNYTYGKPGIYPVTLRVVTSEGCSDSLTKNDTIHALPQLAFSSDKVCLGEKTSFTNASNNTDSYVWIFPKGTSTQTEPSYTFASAGSHLVRLAGANNFGCKDTTQETILVYSLPEAIFSANDVCIHNKTTFVNYSKGGTSYYWDLGNGSDSAAAQFDYTYLAAGNYSVSLTATNSEGCVDKENRQISVFAKPEAIFTAADVCLTNTTNFTNNSKGAASYSWSFGDGATSTKTKPSRTYSNYGKYDVQLIAVSSEGCSDTALQTVEVFQLPVAAFATTNQCDGDTAFFVNQSKLTTSQNWDFGDSKSSSSFHTNHLYGKDGAYTVLLSVLSKNGCADTFSQTITIKRKPIATFTATDVCLTGSTVFSNASLYATKYNWNLADGSSYTGRNPSHIYSKAGSYLVSLVVTNNEGCTDTVSNTVQVFDLPIASFNTSNICLGNKATMTNASSGASSYDWLFGDGSSSTALSPVYGYLSAGNYTVQLISTSTNGCSDTVSTGISVFVTPSAGFSAPVNLCFGEEAVFTDNSKNADSVNWSFSNGLTSNNRIERILFSKDTIYTFTQTVRTINGCADKVTGKIEVLTSPKADYTANSICLGDTMKFINSSIGQVLQSWSFGDDSVAVDSNTQHWFAQAGTYTTTLKVFADNGCSDEMQQTVKVGDKPTIDFSTGNICMGTDAIFINNSSVKVGELTYTWQFGDGSETTEEQPTHLYLTSDTFNVQLIGLSDLGCKDSIQMKTVVGEQPSVGFSHSLACSGQSFTLTDTSKISRGTLLTKWIIGNDTVAGAVATHQFDQAGTYSVAMLTQSDRGCGSIVTSTITVGEVPLPRFISAIRGCEETEVDFLDMSSIETKENLNYYWNFGDGSPTDSNQDPVHTFIANGKISVTQTVITDIGCKDSITRVLTIHPSPKISIDWKEEGAFVYFNPQDTNLYSYEWDFGNGQTSRFAKARNFYNQNGKYVVTLTAKTNKGCEKQLVETIQLLHTATGETLSIVAKAYPNPFRDYVKIEWPTDETVGYQIFNLSGQLIGSGMVQKDGSISTEHLSAANYIIKVSSKTDHATFMLNKIE